MPAAPQNRLQILLTRIKELDEEVEKLYNTKDLKRFGHKWNRLYQPILTQRQGIILQIKELGGQYNLVAISAISQGENVKMFLTNISVQDTVELLKHTEPQLEKVLVEEVAIKKWFSLG